MKCTVPSPNPVEAPLEAFEALDCVVQAYCNMPQFVKMPIWYDCSDVRLLGDTTFWVMLRAWVIYVARGECFVVDVLVGGAKNGGIKLAPSMELSGELSVLHLGLRGPDNEIVHSVMQLWALVWKFWPWKHWDNHTTVIDK